MNFFTKSTKITAFFVIVGPKTGVFVLKNCGFHGDFKLCTY